MRRDPIVCPACDTPFEVNTSTRSRRQRSAPESEPAAPTSKATTETEEGLETLAGEGTDGNLAINEEEIEKIEDSENLSEDDEDMAAVIEGGEEPEKPDT